MKKKVILFIIVLFGTLNLLSKPSDLPGKSVSNTSVSAPLLITNLDSIIFDLANATLSSTFIDIPIYIKSDDVINSFDFAMRFNLAKLTYSTVTNLVSTDATIISSAYFNPNDLFLRYTGSSLQSYPTGNGIYVTNIRFTLLSPCTPLSTSDFTDILAILNGTQSSFRMTSLNFSKFIPVAGFNSGPACLNTGTQFSDLSSLGSGSLTAWSWSFDNGNTSALQNPSITFTNTGNITSTLIVTANNGCKDTSVMSFVVNLPPVSSFSYVVDCIKDSVFFNNTSSIASGSIAGSLWNFGDSQGTSNAINPSYHYNASGLYTVTLLSTSNFSCTSASSVMVDLNNKVSANFTISSVKRCIGSEIQFIDVSTYSLNSIASWAWNFGNGANSTLQNPSTTYTAAGNYSVLLASTSSDGCKGFITQNITIGSYPSVQFGVNTVTTCALATASFTDLSNSPAGSSYSWNFGNGSISNLPNPVYSYSNAGVYQVKLVITTLNGCADSLSSSYNVVLPSQNPAPFTYSVIANTEVLFTNLNPSAISVLWDFGDNQNSVLNAPLHYFQEPLSYKVCLKNKRSVGLRVDFV